MPTLHVFMFTTLAMLAFAANSLLCRMALAEHAVDAASFTMIRMLSGAVVLFLFVVYRDRQWQAAGSWYSALALFIYAACFSLAYKFLATGTGALLLFGSVQCSMISFALYKGERLSLFQSVGLVCAYSGLVFLLLPGIEAPPLLPALAMACAGVAWGVYSLRGRSVSDATLATAGNFIRTIPMAIIFLVAFYVLSSNGANAIYISWQGVVLSVASGALASGLGYAIWYFVLPSLQSTSAASVQLSVPVVAAFAGVLFLSEPISIRFLIASVAILGGVAATIWAKQN